ncbi:MAG TPA: TonB-dependent receptor [Bryobacteraceae bacterium]|nr:TonB-dependent receptor [Bryobacteraceae bacterium]
MALFLISWTLLLLAASDPQANQSTRPVIKTESVTVTATVTQVDAEHPDPAQRVNVREDILDANPGRPGAPVSIPGLPVETASSGIKAPQYFAPGVAGDHGEPIAQYLQVGSYLLPNNLSANAHGNGYSDPNILIPATIEAVETDGGAFNVREGNHSVDLAADYLLRSSLQPFVTLTGDYRDIDLAAGWSPANPAIKAWLAMQVSYGNGFLDALEHRQQYKLNGFRIFQLGRHQLTLYGIGYYGESKVPGLVPIGVPNLHDTIDCRQRDQTHTGELALNDVWRITPASELQLSGFFRTYNLALDSNFGDGLIRQSEFRTESGANATYIRRLNQRFSILAGIDDLREAPRRLDLDHYTSTDPAVYGPFTAVTANNVTLNLLSPYIAIDGRIASWLHLNLGWRRDQIDFDNIDLLHTQNSFHGWVGFNSPKATLSLLAPDRSLLPRVSFSFGEAFFTNDPRIGTGQTQGTPVSRTHSYQMVVEKTIARTDFRVTLGHITQEASLAKIDADTGLQFDEGPSRNQYITVSARRYFRVGFVQASISKADARDLSGGNPVPEAPRLILDLLGTLDRLPFQLHARAEFEEVGRKPLGDGFTGVPVREFRGALMRQFGDRFQAGVNFLIASGYTGQTTEVLALPGDADPFERAVGVRMPSYASLSFTYRFGRIHP